MRWPSLLKHRPRTAVARRLAVAAAILALTGCATTRGPRSGEQAFYGVAGDHFVRLDPDTGAAERVATSPRFREVRAMTWDPGTGTLYAIADGGEDPRLIAVDPLTGAVTVIGPIDLPDLDVTLAEGLVFDPGSGTLYATGSHSTFASDRLLTVDPASGRAREAAPIQGTPQNDGDALAIYQGELYVVDVVAGASAVYEIDPRTGRASPRRRSFPKAITDLVFDPAGRRVVAAVRDEPALLEMSWRGGEVTERGPIHGDVDFSGSALAALTCACEVRGLLVDGFESGDLSTWRARRKPPPSPGGSR